MKTNFKFETGILFARRRCVFSPSGRKKVARRFNGGLLEQNQSSPAGTAEK
jgi:hypothetical protein